jgi:hypothetical protein
MSLLMARLPQHAISWAPAAAVNCLFVVAVIAFCVGPPSFTGSALFCHFHLLSRSPGPELELLDLLHSPLESDPKSESSVPTTPPPAPAPCATRATANANEN